MLGQNKVAPVNSFSTSEFSEVKYCHLIGFFLEEIKLFIQQKFPGEKEYSLILLSQMEIKMYSYIVQFSSDVIAKYICITSFYLLFLITTNSLDLWPLKFGSLLY